MNTTVLQKRYNSARINLIAVVALSALNLVLLATGGDSYFLFSASVPYIITATMMALCGMFPPEFYVDFDMGGEFFDQSFFYVALVISVVIILFYLLCWIFSRKNRGGWLIAALVAFIIDTLVMFFYYGFALDMIIDIVLHIYVVGSLVSGVLANKKLNLEPSPVGEANSAIAGTSQDTVRTDSTALRPADMTVKYRTLLEHEEGGYRILYRRVGKTNELVINGQVYAEYVALMEFAHQLTAVVNGHEICAGFDGISKSYITFDGVLSAEKVRLI